MDSILDSVKLMLGIPVEYEAFDAQLIMHINSVFTVLNQLGVGTDKFTISDNSATWSDFIGTEDDVNIEAVRSYMYLKVKMIFDPPSNSVTAEAFKSQIAEFEWRLRVETDDWERNGV